MTDRLFVVGWSAWALGIETREDWSAWRAEPTPLPRGSTAPALPFADSMFKRRLSQLSRMVVHVGHEALFGRVPMNVTLASVYGEINQQYRISEKLVQSGEVSPAAFSLSVFNTSVAALAIVERNTAGYVAVFPGSDAFGLGLLEAASAVLSGRDPRRLFIASDEELPAPYAALSAGAVAPHALALVLSSDSEPGAVELSAEAIASRPWRDDAYPEPIAFLRYMLA